jgi:hypothetical protein
MFIICHIKSIKERSLTYHPGGMSEINKMHPLLCAMSLIYHPGGMSEINKMHQLLYAMSLIYHPGGMSEISRGLREAIPPDSSASTSLIPEGLHKINAQMKYPVSSLRDERETGDFTFRGYRFSQPPANLCNPHRDLRNPYTVIAMDKLCFCFFQEKHRAVG